MSWELEQWQQHLCCSLHQGGELCLLKKLMRYNHHLLWHLSPLPTCPSSLKPQLSPNKTEKAFCWVKIRYGKSRWFSGSKHNSYSLSEPPLLHIVWCVPTPLTITALFTKHLHVLLVELVGVWRTNLFSARRPCFRPFSLSCSSKHQGDFLVSVGHHNV